jgi:hypothetical protein
MRYVGLMLRMQEDAMAHLRHGNWNSDLPWMSDLRWMVAIGSMAVLLLGFVVLGPDGFFG